MSQHSLVRFEPQLEDGYCLPACVRMVLAALAKDLSQQRIAHLLGTSDAGTPFSRLHRLTSLGLRVEIAVNGTIERLQMAMNANTPVIAAVHAGWLPHAQIESPHAVVVVGISAAAVTVLDPATTSEPVDVPLDAWLAAWIEMDLAYAVITA